MTSNKC